MDNGIGRKKAKSIRSKSKYHHPTGLKNVEERIDIINKTFKSQMSMEIMDLEYEGNPSGTKIKLLLHSE